MTSPPPLPLPLHLCHPYVCHTWPACPSPRPLAGVGLRSLTSLALWLQKDQVHTLMGTVFEKPLLDHLNGELYPNVDPRPLLASHPLQPRSQPPSHLPGSEVKRMASGIQLPTCMSWLGWLATV